MACVRAILSTDQLLETSRICCTIQNVPGGKVNILGGHSIGHFNQKKKVYMCMSYSERFPR
jgi:hypothetical protein